MIGLLFLACLALWAVVAIIAALVISYHVGALTAQHTTPTALRAPIEVGEWVAYSSEPGGGVLCRSCKEYENGDD